MELYREHRPKELSDVIGQTSAVRILETFREKGAFPHTFLFTGPSGVGKTTLARIMAGLIGCEEFDLREVNSADLRGIDEVRDIRKNMSLLPIAGLAKGWIIDECHRMTKASQSALLKMLEDPPNHVYFFLCTTEPTGLLRTIHTRSSLIKLSPLSKEDLRTVIKSILDKEGKKIPSDVRERIIQLSDGSARQALVYLQQVIELSDKTEMLESLSEVKSEKQAIDLCHALMYNRRWSEICSLIKEINDEPETIRRIMLNYSSKVILNGKPRDKKSHRAYALITAFSDNFYDSGLAGLVAACWEIYSTSKNS